LYAINTHCVEIGPVVKDAAISIRVEPSLKERLEAEAEKKGQTLAKYVEQALEVHSRPPRIVLKEPQITHSGRTGTRIVLDLADGWPVALLPLDHAEKLAKELQIVVATAKKLG
jgi:HicB family